MVQSLLMVVLIILALSVASGLLAALPILLPPLRRRGRESVTARAVETVVCGLLAFALMFAAWNYLRATYAGLWIGLGGGYTSDISDNNPFYTEMWLRSALPPSTQPVCYTQDARGCRVADYYMEHAHAARTAWFDYGLTLVVSTVTGTFGGLWARRFSRPAAAGTA